MAHESRGNERAEHFTKMIRHTMQSPAWCALSVYAQAIYPWLKLEWHGPKANNNGRIRLSVRQAAAAVGINPKTAGTGLQDLQAKGFIVMTEPARLGIGGRATSPCWEITEIAMPNSHPPRPRRLFLDWKKGCDFPVYRAAAQNPSGRNGISRVVKMKVVT